MVQGNFWRLDATASRAAVCDRIASVQSSIWLDFSILSRHSEMFEQSSHRIRFIWLIFFFFVSAVD
jgi:hypothetical protein